MKLCPPAQCSADPPLSLIVLGTERVVWEAERIPFCPTKEIYPKN